MWPGRQSGHLADMLTHRLPNRGLDSLRMPRAVVLVVLVFGQPFVKQFALCYRTVVLSCLSVWPVFPVCLSVCNVGVLWPNGWMDQDETWHAGRPRPWPHCFAWGPSSPPPKGHSPPIFGPYLLWPNGCMDQDATWHGGRSRPRPHCARWGATCPSPKGAQPPIFGQCLLWPLAKRLDGSR